MFLLRCPKCGHQMKYNSTDKILTAKVKKCVYCNHSFKIIGHIVKEE